MPASTLCHENSITFISTRGQANTKDAHAQSIAELRDVLSSSRACRRTCFGRCVLGTGVLVARGRGDWPRLALMTRIHDQFEFVLRARGRSHHVSMRRVFDDMVPVSSRTQQIQRPGGGVVWAGIGRDSRVECPRYFAIGYSYF